MAAGAELGRPIAPWRDLRVRALACQVAVLALVLGAVWRIAANTRANLEQRGIASGFAFLGNEAGFAVSEATPLPVLDGALLSATLVVALGAVAVVLARGRARRKGVDHRSDSLCQAALLIMLLLLLTVVVVGADRLSFRTYSAADTYLQALAVGAANTLKVSVLGCLGATVLGGAIGISRLSSNWLLARLAAAYVEIVRNVPLLVQLSFWYFAVLGALPGPRDSIALGLATLNNRGLYLPWPVLAPPWRSHVVALVAGVALASLWRFRRLRAHSRLPPLAGGGPGWGGGRLVGPLLAVGPSAVTLALTGTPLYFDYPVLAGFNFRGGVALTPELTALLGGLILYTAAFVAEIVRSGILAVPAGQREAALALGLSRGRTLHLVLLPQALRVMIPPLTNQYLNLTKNSSLGVAIAYPEIVSVGGTVLNQSGQAIETIGIMMAVYLGLSLSISAYMSWHHAQGQRAER